MRVHTVVAVALFVAGAVFGRFVIENGLPAWAGGGDSVDGDVNGDGALNLTDPVYLLEHLFSGGPAPVPCDGTVGEPRLAFLVRHGERDGLELGAEGRARAECLAAVFSSMELDALIASDLIRTQQTLEPLLASQEGVSELLITDDTGAAAAAAVRGLPPGTRAVIAHHSYTIGDILFELGAVERSFSIPSSEYDSVWVVTVPTSGPAQMVKLRYCEP